MIESDESNLTKTTRLIRLLAVSTVIAASTLSASAANWPAWRGPYGTGVCQEQSVPLHWSTNQNVRWCAPLPDRGNSTPIIWGNRVFVTQAIEKEFRRTLMCFDRRDGKVLWQRGTIWTEPDSGGDANPPCTSSPVTDGKRVIAWFGSAGVYCYDLAGHELWHRDLGRQSHGWGYASSPVIYKDLCLLNFGPGERSFLIALDKETGRTAWQYDVNPIAADTKWEDLGGDLNEWKRMGSPKVGEVSGSCATPLVVRTPDRDEVVVTYPLRIMGFAPDNGKPLWVCGGPNTGAYSSPFSGDGLLAAMGSGLKNSALVVRPGGTGDVTATHRLWNQVPASSKACIGSGVVFRGRIYQVSMMGFAQCLELLTGQTVWDERLTGTGSRNSSYSSVVLAGDRLYAPNQNGDVFVLRASPKFECLATNSIGGEPMNSSLAVSGGAFFLRTDRRLWCVGEGKSS